MPPLRFENHDDCGDLVVPIAGVHLQAANVASNAFFVAAGWRLVTQARSPEARQSGALLLGVACSSSLYHATSTWGGFLLDITGMAVWVTHLAGSCQVACEAMGYPIWPKASRADWRCGAAVLACVLAVGAPFLSFEVGELSPIAIWHMWVVSFIVLVLLAALPLVYALGAAGRLRAFLPELAEAVGVVLVGVAFAQLTHLVCAPGYFTTLPLHALWHLCSARSAYLTVSLLDRCLALPARSEDGDAGDRRAGKDKQQ